MVLSLSNHKSNSADMADNIDVLIDDLSMIKGFKVIFSTKIE
jgi:hypothetical protein